MISKDLIKLIRSEFVLDWYGIHGVSHWARVRINGLKLAELTGAKVKIVELFAFLHDSKRKNENRDKDHGLRAAEFAYQINDSFLFLDKKDLDLLTFACTHHSAGILEGDITVHVTLWAGWPLLAKAWRSL
ncbi:MAG TPA: hypothetical protein PKY82_24565, partial [Pyrinomonadaceae bacterium]|nr:hypothetical protein [Pyrinomonadaceae bacterium]